METLLPDGWSRPKGFANGIAAEGRMIFVAGQIGWTPDGIFECDDLAGQVRQTLVNILAVLAEAKAGPEHVVRMTWYITDLAEYRATQGPIGEAYRDLMGSNYPAMSVVQVSALVEDQAKVEIEATAVITND